MPNPDLEIFLKLDGIDGESTVRGHEKEIVVRSYDQSLAATVYHSGGGGSGTGKTTFSPVRFRKDVDAASIPMLLACASGQHIAHAKFTFRRTASAFEFYKVTLDSVLVTHVAQRAGTGEHYPLSFDAMNAGAPDDGFLDEVTLEFARIHWEYRSEHPHAGHPAAITGGWDVEAYKKI